MTVIRGQPNQHKGPRNSKLALDADDIRLCPRCGDEMHPPFMSRSRIYKKTYICPDCGQTEAMLQLAGKDATWHPVIYEWNLTLERHQQEVDSLEGEIESLNRDYDNIAKERNVFQSSAKQLREENRRFSERHEKNKEVIHQLTDKIKFMDQQIKDLLSNMLHTGEDT